MTTPFPGSCAWWFEEFKRAVEDYGRLGKEHGFDSPSAQGRWQVVVGMQQKMLEAAQTEQVRSRDDEVVNQPR